MAFSELFNFLFAVIYLSFFSVAQTTFTVSAYNLLFFSFNFCFSFFLSFSVYTVTFRCLGYTTFQSKWPCNIWLADCNACVDWLLAVTQTLSFIIQNKETSLNRKDPAPFCRNPNRQNPFRRIMEKYIVWVNAVVLWRIESFSCV